MLLGLAWGFLGCMSLASSGNLKGLTTLCMRRITFKAPRVTIVTHVLVLARFCSASHDNVSFEML